MVQLKIWKGFIFKPQCCTQFNTCHRFGSKSTPIAKSTSVTFRSCLILIVHCAPKGKSGAESFLTFGHDNRLEVNVLLILLISFFKIYWIKCVCFLKHCVIISYFLGKQELAFLHFFLFLDERDAAEVETSCNLLAGNCCGYIRM